MTSLCVETTAVQARFPGGLTHPPKAAGRRDLKLFTGAGLVQTEQPMRTTTFALILGIVFLVVGAAGFIPGLVSPIQSGDHMTVTGGYGNLLGLFPVNWLHSLVHVLFGIWGVVAYRSYDGARMYARGVAVIYAVLAVAGLIPGLRTTFGLIPLFGHDIWLHALIAAASAYFGFANPEPAEASRV